MCVTQEKAISIQELTDLLASSLRSSQISSQAPIAAPLQFFVNCKLQKTDGFPLLYTEKNGSIQRLNHNASTYWICDMGNWAAAHGLHNIFELCDALVTISADGSQRLPLFRLNPQYENFAQEHEGMRSVLLLISSTTFGMYHKVIEEQVLHMEERQIRAMFADLVQVALMLPFRLSHAAKLTKVSSIPSILPELFANSNLIMQMNERQAPALWLCHASADRQHLQPQPTGHCASNEEKADQDDREHAQ